MMKTLKLIILITVLIRRVMILHTVLILIRTTMLTLALIKVTIVTPTIK